MKEFLLYLFISITAVGHAQSIFKTIEDKDYPKLEKLLQKGVSAEQFNEKGLTPLWMAVFKNDTVAVHLLLKYKADVNFLERNGMHPIMIGCLSNSLESVRILLDNGVDVNWRSASSRNQQPIRFASQGGSLKLVQLLLLRGADMESTPDDKATPLLAALHARKFDIAEFYFTNGANVNVVGRDGECVIHEAIKTNNPEMVRLAIAYRAPLKINTPDGKSTLQLAKKSGNAEIETLVKNALEVK